MQSGITSAVEIGAIGGTVFLALYMMLMVLWIRRRTRWGSPAGSATRVGPSSSGSATSEGAGTPPARGRWGGRCPVPAP